MQLFSDLRHRLPSPSRAYVPLAFSGYVALAFLGCFSGCSGVDSVPEISGNVSFEGTPVANGLINFLAVDANDAVDFTAPRASAKIVDGQYRLSAPRGKKLVSIEVYESRNDPNAAADGYPGAQASQIVSQVLPEEFNVKSTLRYNVDQPDAAADFNLSSAEN